MQVYAILFRQSAPYLSTEYLGNAADTYHPDTRIFSPLTVAGLSVTKRSQLYESNALTVAQTLRFAV